MVPSTRHKVVLLQSQKLCKHSPTGLRHFRVIKKSARNTSFAIAKPLLHFGKQVTLEFIFNIQLCVTYKFYCVPVSYLISGKQFPQGVTNDIIKKHNVVLFSIFRKNDKA